MSALAQSVGSDSSVGRSSSFSAHLALAAGVSVSIHAPTLPDLQAVVAKLQPAANDAKAPAASPSPTPAPPPGNAAPTATPASAPPAASGSAQSGDAQGPTYDDVKARVLKLAKISRETAQGVLGTFKTAKGAPVDHGNKLELADYPAFIAAADKLIAEKANA